MTKPFLLSIFLDQRYNFPVDWVEQIIKCAEMFSTKHVLDGTSSTSCPLPGFTSTTINVVTGKIISEKLPWLFRLYQNELKKIASDFFEKELFISNNLDNCININSLYGKGMTYERHVDSNNVTGLLFCSTLHHDSGGQLVFDSAGGRIAISPQKGMFLAFDATTTPHYVTPLSSDFTRLSIAMNYYLESLKQARPNDLDNYLYNNNIEKNT